MHVFELHKENVIVPEQLAVKSHASPRAEIKNHSIKRKKDTFSGEATVSKLFWLPSEKGHVLKENNLLPIGTQTGSHKSHLPCKNGAKLPLV